MKKCDFCTKSTPNGKCTCLSSTLGEYNCQLAIKRMMEALNATNTRTNIDLGKGVKMY